MNSMTKWLFAGGIVLFVWLLYLLSPVLVPFAVGALLAYLGNPLVNQLQKKGLPRTSSVIVFFTVLLFLGVVVLLVVLPQLEKQISGLLAMLPQFISWLQENILPRLGSLLGVDPDSLDMGAVKQVFADNAKEVGGITHRLFAVLGYSGQWLLLWFGYLALIPVVTFYLLRDWPLLVSRVHKLIPVNYQRLVGDLTLQCDAVLAEFLRGQSLVMLAQAVLYSLGLWLIDLNFSLLIGSLAGLLSFVPYLGFIIGIVTALVVGFMQFQDLIHLFYIVIVFGFVQFIEGVLLSPMLVGDRIGLHPVAVIFAAMAGGQLFGFIGILLALPVAAVLVVLLRYAHQRYLHSSLYQS